MRLQDFVRPTLDPVEPRSGALGRVDVLVMALAAGGAVVLVALDFYQRRIRKDVIEIFDIDGQRNLTTWFHSSILLGAALCALLLATVATQRGWRLRWLTLGLCLAFFSLDKGISLHERVGRELADAWSLSDAAARVAWQAAWSPIILTAALILLLVARDSGPRIRTWLLLMLAGGGIKLVMEALMFPLIEYGGVSETRGWFYGTEVEIEETVQLMAFACLFAALAQLLFDNLSGMGGAEEVVEVAAEKRAPPVAIPLSGATPSGSGDAIRPSARDTRRT